MIIKHFKSHVDGTDTTQQIIADTALRLLLGALEEGDYNGVFHNPEDDTYFVELVSQEDTTVLTFQFDQ